jgi:2'-5' RNA ligase
VSVQAGYYGPPGGAADPVVVTARLDPQATARFQAWRDALFPPGRTQVAAHLTLFHRLPGEALPAIAAAVAERAPAGQINALAASPRFLGRGFAVDIEAPALVALHTGLARAWSPWLTPQDRQRFHPHVTLQNKADPAAARKAYAAFSADFVPFAIRIEGIDLFVYRGGPWEPAGTVPFTGG